eukprot:c19923_g1_i1.p1 GENE.c19923_g1_i1~~c19923_g1_i1.p1  ORF type:complete len:260 (-),score=48.56 c19923_g1_i1:847-1563(-)
MISVVLGGSGQVGIHIVRNLVTLNSVSEVRLISRRPLQGEPFEHPKVRVVILEDLNRIEDISPDTLTGASMAFNTLGIGKPSKFSKEDLMRVDTEIPSAFARSCVRAGISVYSHMSAVGADETSNPNGFGGSSAGFGFYNHTKGRGERLAREAGFRYVDLFRPAAILGAEATPRILELMTPMLNVLLPAKFRGEEARDIGRAMVWRAIKAVEENKSGVFEIEGKDLRASIVGSESLHN